MARRGGRTAGGTSCSSPPALQTINLGRSGLSCSSERVHLRMISHARYHSRRGRRAPVLRVFCEGWHPLCSLCNEVESLGYPTGSMTPLLPPRAQLLHAHPLLAILSA